MANKNGTEKVTLPNGQEALATYRNPETSAAYVKVTDRGTEITVSGRVVGDITLGKMRFEPRGQNAIFVQPAASNSASSF